MSDTFSWIEIKKGEYFKLVLVKTDNREFKFLVYSRTSYVGQFINVYKLEFQTLEDYMRFLDFVGEGLADRHFVKEELVSE